MPGNPFVDRGRSWVHRLVRKLRLALRRWERHGRPPALRSQRRDPRAHFWRELREGQREAADRTGHGKPPST